VAAPTTTIWPADPHTFAKHAILRGYLEAWFPILGSRQKRIVYYDGFAGPGRYKNEEPGSPLVALEVACQHQKILTGEVIFIFVEDDGKRAEWLEQRELPKLHLPSNFKTQVLHDNFANALRSMLDQLDSQGLQLAPTFAFIDPFGMTGLPFELIARLLRRKSCEVLVTFMARDINRFVSELPNQVAELIGDPSAPDAISAAPCGNGAAEAKRRYAASLRQAAKFVRTFQMRDVNGNLVYELFFATNHHLGHEKMKQAMWKVDESGTFSFSDGLDLDQLVIFTPTSEADLAPRLWNHFRGRELDVRDVFEHAQHTVFLEKHVRSALALLEKGRCPGVGRIQVAEFKRDQTKRKKWTFPSGTIVRFVD
jgi:three-Cys-motif partner protein